MSVLYHGGAPDLQPGDSIEPGHSRDNYDDCPICRARREKGADAIEGTGHPEQVYCTRYRDYAALYASMYGKGDVYQVRPVGELEASDEDFDGCYRCDRLVIVRAVERHVTLTPKRRRKVIRLMQRLDDGPCINPLPRNATPQMVEKFIQRSAADGLEGAATGMALAGGHWLLSLLFLLLTVLFAINGWRAVGRARMRKTECREFVVDGCHNLIIAGDD